MVQFNNTPKSINFNKLYTVPSKHSPHSKIKENLALFYLLELRKAGATYKQLAEIFNCDFSTIYHYCKKYEIQRDYRWNNSPLALTPNVIFIITRNMYQFTSVPNETVDEKWYVYGNERVNKGKTYKEYLQEQSHGISNRVVRPN